MITALVVEDESRVRKALINMINEYCSNVKIIDSAYSVESALKSVKSHQPDIIFLDIQLPDGTGFDLLNFLKDTDSKVIFVTAYSEFAIKAIKYGAFDYILKPVIPEELVEAVNKVSQVILSELKLKNETKSMTQTPKEQSTILIKTKNDIYRIKVAEILYCTADVNYTKLILTNNREIMVAKTLKNFEEEFLQYDFIRVHHKHLVNSAHILKVHNNLILMSNHQYLEISRRKKSDIIEYLNKGRQ